jgi:hypothetical protein
VLDQAWQINPHDIFFCSRSNGKLCKLGKGAFGTVSYTKSKRGLSRIYGCTVPVALGGDLSVGAQCAGPNQSLGRFHHGDFRAFFKCFPRGPPGSQQHAPTRSERDEDLGAGFFDFSLIGSMLHHSQVWCQSLYNDSEGVTRPAAVGSLT